MFNMKDDRCCTPITAMHASCYYQVPGSNIFCTIALIPGLTAIPFKSQCFGGRAYLPWHVSKSAVERTTLRWCVSTGRSKTKMNNPPPALMSSLTGVKRLPTKKNYAHHVGDVVDVIYL